MAQIKPHDPRFCTKEQIAKDAAFVLAAPLAHGTKHGVLSRVTWVWTEFDGKYFGCPNWTDLAVMQFLHEKSIKGLRHEHVVPKQVVIGMLLELDSPTPGMVYEICERFLIGVVVTKEEDGLLSCDYRKTMPAEFFDPTSDEYHDPWLRHRRCGIKWRSGVPASGWF